MKKWVKIIIMVVNVIILCFVIDLICICTINRPLFAIKEDNGDSVNVIYKGILYDTYSCFDYSSTEIVFKGVKFTCAEKIKIDKFKNYDFSVVVTTPTEYQKIFAFEHDNINYYYGNTNFRLYLSEGNYKYDLETALTNNLVDFNDILERNVGVDTAFDGGSKIYRYHLFNVIVCNTIDGNNDVIIGESEMEIGDFCYS